MKKVFVILLALLTLSGCVHEEQEHQSSRERESSLVSSNSNVSNESITSNSEENESSKTGNEGGSDIPWIH